MTTTKSKSGIKIGDWVKVLEHDPAHQYMVGKIYRVNRIDEGMLDYDFLFLSKDRNELGEITCSDEVELVNIMLLDITYMF